MTWRIPLPKMILSRSKISALRTSFTKTPTFSICTDDGISCVERCKRVSPSTTVLFLFLPTLLRRVSVPCYSRYTNPQTRSYISDTTTTAFALSFKLYEKPLLNNLNYQTFSLSSIMTGTTLHTDKHMSWHRVFPLCLLMSGNSEIVKGKRCARSSLLYCASQYGPRGRSQAERSHKESEGTFHGRLGPGQQSREQFPVQLSEGEAQRLVILDSEWTEGTTAVENLRIKVRSYLWGINCVVFILLCLYKKSIILSVKLSLIRIGS